jgi:RNA polymerase sigma factor (sigma-70 family)
VIINPALAAESILFVDNGGATCYIGAPQIVNAMRSTMEEGDMVDNEWLAEQFEAHRARLTGVAVRMLGSRTEADDAVQESWLRLSRSGADGIENLGGWLTTVVSRVCLDMLRSRKSRADHTTNGAENERLATVGDEQGDPEHEALLAESLGPALVVVLETLAPAERLAFVLHDMFAVSFEDIGVILSRSPNAAKQLASRARRRVQGSDVVPDGDRARQRAVVDAFLAASRSGNFEALLAVLDPQIVLHADGAGVQMGAAAEVRSAADVAGVFCGRAMGAEPALIDGSVGIAWAPGGRPKVVWEMTIVDDKVTRIDMIAASESLDDLDLLLLG